MTFFIYSDYYCILFNIKDLTKENLNNLFSQIKRKRCALCFKIVQHLSRE